MTQTTPRRGAAAVVKKAIISVLEVGIALAAFRLSFSAQVTLATSAGIEADLAWIYPLIVDAAIVAGMLIRRWAPTLDRAVAGYLWFAIGFWTLTSIVGNGFHIIVLPPELVQLPLPAAIAVNALPGVSLFLIVHISMTVEKAAPTVIEAPAPVVVTPAPKRPRAPRTATTTTAARSSRGDLPLPTDAELLEMVDQKMTTDQIAAQIGRSRSTAGDYVKRAKDARDARLGISA